MFSVFGGGIGGGIGGVGGVCHDADLADGRVIPARTTALKDRSGLTSARKFPQ